MQSWPGLLHGNGNDFWRQEGLCYQREYDGCQEQNQCLLIWDSSNWCRQDWDQSKQHQWRISRMFRIQLDCDLQQAAASNPHHSNISASAKLLRVSSSATSVLVVHDSTSSFIIDFVRKYSPVLGFLHFYVAHWIRNVHLSVCPLPKPLSLSESHISAITCISHQHHANGSTGVSYLWECFSDLYDHLSLSAMPKRSLHSQNWLLNLV